MKGLKDRSPSISGREDGFSEDKQHDCEEGPYKDEGHNSHSYEPHIFSSAFSFCPCVCEEKVRELLGEQTHEVEAYSLALFALACPKSETHGAISVQGQVLKGAVFCLSVFVQQH